MLEKYFKFWVKILNNLENEHQGCPITIAEEDEVTGLKIKSEIFDVLEKCENGGLRSQFDCMFITAVCD